MPKTIFSNPSAPANVTSFHIHGITPGNLIVRLEYVTSQEHLNAIVAGSSKPDSLEVLLTPHQAQNLARGLQHWSKKIAQFLKSGPRTAQ